MPKIIEMKKNAFLKKIKKYAARKKETPLKLYMTPSQLSVVKIKFVFAKTHEVVLQPHDLLFFKQTPGAILGKSTKANPTDSDSGKTYLFTFCAPLLQELTRSKIYVGRSPQEKLEALATYLTSLKDDKIIFEIVSRVDLNTTGADIKTEDEKDSGFAVSDSVSLVEISESGSFTGELGIEIKEDGDVSSAFFEEYRSKLEEQGFIIEGLEDKVEAYRKLAEQNGLKAKEGNLEIRNLKQALKNLESDYQELKAFQVESLQAAAMQAAKNEAMQGDETGNLIEDIDGQEEEIKDDGIDNLIAELENEEIDTSLHLSEAVTQWNHMLLWSRNEPVTVQIYNTDQEADEEQILARFIAIAKLERERAAHFANSDNPWPKEGELARIKSDGYGFDLKCFSLYQKFPEELKQFAVLFAFWEAAHHNRFYRNALGTVLNGGEIPKNLGMTDDTQMEPDPIDVMLKLLHYTDATRILMGHYDCIAQNKFDVDLFVSQDENIARFKGIEKDDVDISRTTTEDALFM